MHHRNKNEQKLIDAATVKSRQECSNRRPSSNLQADTASHTKKTGTQCAKMVQIIIVWLVDAKQLQAVGVGHCTTEPLIPKLLMQK